MAQDPAVLKEREGKGRAGRGRDLAHSKILAWHRLWPRAPQSHNPALVT